MGDADYLQIHKTLARRRLWSRKTWLASALACGLSLILWLVAVPVPWHLGAVALVFILGLFAPLRPALDWALSWISRSGGLSYETALELEGTNDAYGFSEAVQKRAATQAARLELPEQQAWWLPLLFMAVVLALLPVVPFRTATRLPFDTNRIGTERTPETPPEPGTTPVSETENEDEENQDSEAASEQPEGEQDAASTIEDFNAPDGASPEANSERVADEEALERFLENMRERPQSEEEQVNPFSPVNPQPQAGEEGQGEGEGEEGPRAEQGEGESGEEGEQGQEGEQGESGSQESAEQDGEEGEQGESGEAGDEGGEETAGEPGESGEEGEGGEAGAAEAEQGSEDGGLAEEGDGSDGTGNLPGSLSLTEGEDLGEPGSDPEQIRGRLDDGPSNLAGTVRLPGTVDGSQETGGAAASTFNQTEEQAITEGRIPVEYQEIIRNYFR